MLDTTAEAKSQTSLAGVETTTNIDIYIYIRILNVI